MSNLVITGVSKPINPEFVKLFLAISENPDGSAHEMHFISALAEADTVDEVQDSYDISTMAEFMLITGTQLAYRDVNCTFHFGDVDLMDMIDDRDGMIIIQHELED